MSDLQAQFRQALSSFATGVTIITTRTDTGDNVGVTASSFNSVSLEPPLVLWSIAKTSGSLKAFVEADYFAIHVLSIEQDALSNRFASRGIDKFEGVEVQRGEGNVPLLDGCCARFQCKTSFQYEGGDHVIIVGEVVAFDQNNARPLLFHGGKYSASAPIAQLPEDVGNQDMHELLRNTHFKLLYPVRKERECLEIALEEHYILDVLLAGSRPISEIDEVISYTGLRATEVQVEAMLKRGLVCYQGDGKNVELSQQGRQVVVRLRSAAQAVQAEVAIYLGDNDLKTLKALLRRVASGFDKLDERTDRHLRMITGDLTI